jgi:hypothetical protein
LGAALVIVIVGGISGVARAAALAVRSRTADRMIAVMDLIVSSLSVFEISRSPFEDART